MTMGSCAYSLLSNNHPLQVAKPPTKYFFHTITTTMLQALEIWFVVCGLRLSLTALKLLDWTLKNALLNSSCYPYVNVRVQPRTKIKQEYSDMNKRNTWITQYDLRHLDVTNNKIIKRFSVT